MSWRLHRTPQLSDGLLGQAPHSLSACSNAVGQRRGALARTRTRQGGAPSDKDTVSVASFRRPKMPDINSKRRVRPDVARLELNGHRTQGHHGNIAPS